MDGLPRNGIKDLESRLLVGKSPLFLNEIKKITQASICDVSVLISGETGTGKELCARAIHYSSTRARYPFVPINCSTIPPDLVENELFGHERGSFTGAFESRPGLVQEGNGGTLFLDDVDCIPIPAQSKLLRFVQEKEFRPLGSTKSSKANIRIIAATNVDLERVVKSGKFRQDLYYRLNVFPITMPPLRTRREDIPLLADHFLTKFSLEYNREVTSISPEVMQLLLLYEWPGNVRELEHVIERAVILSDESVITLDHILLPKIENPIKQSFKEFKRKVISDFERTYLQALLLVNNGNISRAAEMAQKNRRAFWALIKKHRIDTKNFKIQSKGE